MAGPRKFASCLALTLAAGVAVLTASACDQTAPSPVVPGPVTPLPQSALTSFRITGPSIEVGQQAQFTATATYERGLTVDVTNDVEWKSGNALAGTMSPTGNLRAVAVGVTEVSATFQGVTASQRMMITGPGTYFLVDSDPGDPVGLGKLQSKIRGWVQNVNRAGSLNRIRTSVYDDHNTISWEAEFAGPEAQPILPGVYEHAVLFPPQAPSPYSMRVMVNFKSCDQETGRFVIRDVVYDQGSIARLNAFFEQKCWGATGWLRGEVGYQR